MSVMKNPLKNMELLKSNKMKSATMNKDIRRVYKISPYTEYSMYEYIMKILAILLALLALANANIEWSDLRVRWGFNSEDPLHTKIFFEIPRTLDDAVAAGWVEVPGVNTIWVDTYCLMNDPRFCVLFDSYGYIAGIQAGILVSDVEDVQSVYNMSRLSQYRIKTMFGKEVWISTAYTQDPAVIATGGRSGGTGWDNLTGTEGVWLETTDGYLKVRRNLKDIDSVWVKEACIQTIGTHYFYDIHNTTDCKDLEPWFLLYQGETLTGVGFQGYGKRTSEDRVWYEIITTAQVRIGITDGPQCLYDLSDAYGGVISMHIFFTPEPWKIVCS